MYTLKITIQGIAKAMINRPPIPTTGAGPPRPKIIEALSDAEKAIAEKVYLDDVGMYLPADNIRQMLIGNQARRGAAIILGSDIESKKGTAYKSFCEACLWVTAVDGGEKVYFGPLRKKWDDTDTRYFIRKSGQTITRQITTRPLVCLPWTLTFHVFVTDDNFKSGKIKELFEVAGLRCGVGVYGPKFGRFIVIECKQIKTSTKEKTQKPKTAKRKTA